MTTEQIIKSVPKVLLHDHLDGGLRPQSVIDLAKDEEKEILDRKGMLISPDARLYFQTNSIKMVRG